MLNTTDKIIKHKTGLLNLAGEPGNVSKACQVMGYSRDTFYRYKSAVEDGGIEALFERTRRKPNLANRVDDAAGKTANCQIKSELLHFMVQDHQSFFAILAFGFLAEPDEPLRLQNVVSVALHPRGCPTKIDQELFEDAPRVCADWHCTALRPSRLQHSISVNL